MYLVGAGPGDPGLVTRRALELIASADAIVYDRLIPAGALDGARPTPSCATSARSRASRRWSRRRSTRCWSSLARAGRRVVRLKGGDPFVFGRGGEEAQALAQAGVPFEVVPAVTAGVAAPAYAGHPGDPSRRGLGGRASSPATRTRPRTESALDWEALARFPGTLVFYMGVKQLPQIARAAGRRGPRRARRAGRGDRARHAAGPAHGRRHARRHRRAGGGRRHPAAGHHAGGTGRRAARELAWLEQRPLHGQDGGGHARAGAGQRPGASGCAAGRRGGRDAGDPDRAAPVDGSSSGRARDRLVRLVCVTSPNGGSAAARRRRGRRRRRAQLRRASTSRRSARARPRSCARAASAPTWCRSASIAEGPARRAGRRAARRRSACWSPAPPRRATCCPTACASAAPRSTWSRSTTPSPSRSARRSWSRRARRLRHVHVALDGAASSCRRLARLAQTARASSRSGRSRARPRASSASRRTWRPSSTTSTGWSTALLGRTR